MSDEVLVKVEGVSKKFCRSLKRSLWYGVQDVANEMLGRDGHHNELRKNEFWAVNDVSFELKRGECLGLIGPNGAGKSTLLKMLNGLVKPDKGRITMRGRIGALIELGAGFNPILTARENIYVNGSVLGFSKKEIDQKFDAIVDFAEIEEFIDTPVQNFSSGMKVRLGFAVAAQMEPDVLIIDEVLAVGDDMFRRRCFRRIEDFQKNGKTILFVTHNMQSISSICSTALLLDAGKSVLMATPRETINRYHELIANLEEKKFRIQASQQADEYPSTFAQKPTSLDELRFGNGGAIIQSVIIQNELDQPTDVLTAGSEFTVIICVRFLRSTAEPVVGFTIKTLRGVEVFGTSTQLLNSQVGPTKEGETLVVRFRQRTALGLDTYSLSAAVAEFEQGARYFQDRRLDVQTLKVIGDRRTYGLVDLNSEVQLERGPAKLKLPTKASKSKFASLVKPMPRQVLVFGNQKSGTTAIAALLAKMTGSSCTLDIPPVWKHESDLHSGKLSISQFVTNYPEYFENQVIKEPCLTFLHKPVIENFPDAAQVFVVRHPADNIRSILDRLDTPGNLPEEIDIEKYHDYGAWKDVIGGGLLNLYGEHYVDRLALRWVRAVQVYLANSEKMKLVRYESFLVDKIDVLRSLATDLRLKPTLDISEAIDFQFQRKGINREVSREIFFGNKNLNRIQSITKPYLDYFGYKM